jgi:hypothetical protein
MQPFYEQSNSIPKIILLSKLVRSNIAWFIPKNNSLGSKKLIIKTVLTLSLFVLLAALTISQPQRKVERNTKRTCKL